MPYGFDRLSPGDLDMLVRTVWGEAGGEGTLGQQAVAAVIGNRLASGKYGRTIGEVINAPGQFEVVRSRAGEMAGLSPTSLPYLQVKQALLSMTDDPTRGAVQFYSPSGQSQLGRDAPLWSKGQKGIEIGRHRFYGGNYADLNVGDTIGGPAGAATPVGYSPPTAPVLQ